MESNAGSTLLPIIKIINNTRTELANIVLSYEGLDDSSIKINTLNTSLLDISKIDFLYNLGYSSMNNFLEKNNWNKKLCKFE